jgi:hypothetical protein
MPGFWGWGGGGGQKGDVIFEGVRWFVTKCDEEGELQIDILTYIAWRHLWTAPYVNNFDDMDVDFDLYVN